MRASISNADKSKVTTGISTDPKTKARLMELAEDNHTTISGLITQWAWREKTASEKEKRKAGEKK